MIIKEGTTEAWRYEVRYKPIESMPDFILANKVVKGLKWYNSETKEGEAYLKIEVGDTIQIAKSYKNPENKSFLSKKGLDGEIITGGYEIITAVVALPGTGLYDKKTKEFVT